MQGILARHMTTLSAGLIPAAAESARLQACGQLHFLQRTASSRAGRGGGRKQPSHVKGYDRLLQQWAHMTAQPGKGRRGSAGATYAGSKETTRRKGRARQGGSSSSSWWHGWQDAGLSEAAAARQLHPDELHNLVFGRPHKGSSSSSSSKGASRRQQRKQARQRAKMLRKQAAAAGTARGGYGFAWAEADDAEGYYWYDTDGDEDGFSSDDEYLAGSYSYYSTSSQHPHRQQGWRQGQDRPDWQWWTEEQEREWFQQSWQRQAGGQSRQQQQQQQDRQQQHHSSSSSHRPWWERFEQQRQQQQQQQQQQQSWRRWGYSSNSSSGGSTSGAGSDSSWHKAGPSLPASVLPHLSVLGLQSGAQLQRQQLKAAFHKAAMMWHPDKHPDAAAKASAEAKFKEVKAAYEVLVQHVTG